MTRFGTRIEHITPQRRADALPVMSQKRVDYYCTENIRKKSNENGIYGFRKVELFFSFYMI